MKRKRILITGGSGFVGGHVVNLAKSIFEVHSTFFSNQIQIPGVKLHQVNMADPDSAEQLFRQINPEIIIHTAAISNPDFCEKNIELAKAINFSFTVRLFDLARLNGRRFVFTSTDLVFDGKGKIYKENSPTNPINYYAKTKVDVENYILKFSTNAVIARLALVYGLGITRKDTFFEKTIQKLKSNERVVLFDDQYRSPIWVNDLAAALLELAENDFAGVIHLSGGECVSRWEFGKLMCHILGFSEKLIIRKSMDEMETLAARPKKVCLQSDIIDRVLRTKIHKPKEALHLIMDFIN